MTHSVEEVCSRVLAEFARELGRDGLGPHDDYFEHGGDSLGALHLVGRLRSTVDPGLRMIDLFRHPTAHGLSTAIIARTATGEGDG
jgi:hypothetical protein